MNLTPTPSFRRRRGATSSTPASILTATPALSLALGQGDFPAWHGPEALEEEGRRRWGGASVPAVVDLFEDEVVVQDTVMTLIKGGVGAAPEMPKFEKVEVATSLRPDKEEVVMNASDDGPARPGCGEALSSEPAQEASPADTGKDIYPLSRMMSGHNLLAMNLTLTSTLKIMR